MNCVRSKMSDTLRRESCQNTDEFYDEFYRGLEQSCAVLAVNVSNNDITVTDNAMLVSLIKYDADGAVLRANANSLIDDCDKTVIIDDGDYR